MSLTSLPLSKPASWRPLVAMRRLWAHPTLRFWAALVALNTLLLLPGVLLAGPEGSPLPRLGRDVRSWYDLLVRREHMDLLRLHVEVLLLAVLRVWLPWPRGRRWWLPLAVLFALDGVYQLYAAVMVNFYHTRPNFFNDLAFIRSGLAFVLDSLPVPRYVYALAALAGLAVLGLTAYLTRVLWAQTPTHALDRATRVTLTALWLLALAEAMWLGPSALAAADAVFPSWSAQLLTNWQAARRSQAHLAQLHRLNPFAVYDYRDARLTRRPNIYFLFFESYGSVLYRRGDWRAAYQALLAQWEPRLRQAGWHMATTLSESPVWGGGSWMAYTSALFGLRVTEQQAYLALREQYQTLPYPNLGRYLHRQGYTYAWVTPIARRLSPSLMEKNRRFYGMDVWLTFEDLNYDGPLYGWGPAPPDQYVLGFMREWAQGQSQPVFMVYLTQSSHYPWAPLPPVVDDWRLLAHMHDPRSGKADLEAWKQVPHAQVRRDYWNAVAYTWAQIGDFLLALEDPDAVVIVLGDHQPPRVSARRDTYATILHICARDPAWVDALAAYGFRPGLWLATPTATVRHEGLYSLLVRELVRHYGPPGSDLPPYLPQGLEAGVEPTATPPRTDSPTR